jgi:hypothetical protein
MTEPEKVTVSIYCKIYCENYPILEGEKTGDEIVEHLLSDCGCTFQDDEGDIPLSGDLCIWYLGSNEKFGGIYLKIDDLEWEWEWGFGESNFGYVTEFIDVLRSYQIINPVQHKKLEDAIKVGKTLGDMYQIGNYLKTIKEGKSWMPKITTTKEDMKRFVGDVKAGFEEKGIEYYPASTGRRKRSPV